MFSSQFLCRKNVVVKEYFSIMSGESNSKLTYCLCYFFRKYFLFMYLLIFFVIMNDRPKALWL